MSAKDDGGGMPPLVRWINMLPRTDPGLRKGCGSARGDRERKLYEMLVRVRYWCPGQRRVTNGEGKVEHSGWEWTTSARREAHAKRQRRVRTARGQRGESERYPPSDAETAEREIASVVSAARSTHGWCAAGGMVGGHETGDTRRSAECLVR